MSCNWIASRPAAKRFDISQNFKGNKLSHQTCDVDTNISPRAIARFLEVISWCFMPISFHKNIHFFWPPLIFFWRLQSFKVWFCYAVRICRSLHKRSTMVNLWQIMPTNSVHIFEEQGPSWSVIMCSWEPSLCHCGYTAASPPKQVKSFLPIAGDLCFTCYKITSNFPGCHSQAIFII